MKRALVNYRIFARYLLS